MHCELYNSYQRTSYQGPVLVAPNSVSNLLQKHILPYFSLLDTCGSKLAANNYIRTVLHTVHGIDHHELYGMAL